MGGSQLIDNYTVSAKKQVQPRRAQHGQSEQENRKADEKQAVEQWLQLFHDGQPHLVHESHQPSCDFGAMKGGVISPARTPCGGGHSFTRTPKIQAFWGAIIRYGLEGVAVAGSDRKPVGMPVMGFPGFRHAKEAIWNSRNGSRQRPA